MLVLVRLLVYCCLVFALLYGIYGKSGPPLSEATIFVMWFFVNILDAHSTHVCVKMHGINAEANPVARWLFKRIGFSRYLNLKLIGTAVFGLIGLFFWHEKVAVLAATIVIAGVSLSNYLIYFCYRKPSR